MTSQDLLNLEFLRRATDPATPQEERLAIQEALGFAIANEAEFPSWVMQAFESIGGAIPEEMILWLTDQIEAQPSGRIGRAQLASLGELWSRTPGEAAKARIFDLLIEIERRGEGETQSAAESTAGRILTKELEELYETEREGPTELFNLLDIVLSYEDVSMLSNALSKVRHLDRPELMKQLVEYFNSRLPDVTPQMQEAIHQELRFERG
jgi:hypothetical protein